MLNVDVVETRGEPIQARPTLSTALRIYFGQYPTQLEPHFRYCTRSETWRGYIGFMGTIAFWIV